MKTVQELLPHIRFAMNAMSPGYSQRFVAQHALCYNPAERHIAVGVTIVIALRKMLANKTASPRALKTQVAVVSVDIVGGEEMLDLCYQEDSPAQVDFNVVMTGDGKFVEIQGTAKGEPFSRDAMERLMNLAQSSIAELFKIQKVIYESGLSTSGRT